MARQTASTGTLTTLPALPKSARKPKTMKDCACGCGGQTGSRFLPGHDSRLRGWAIRLERGIVTKEAFPGTPGELKAALGYLASHNSKPAPKTAGRAGKRVTPAEQPTGGDAATA